MKKQIYDNLVIFSYDKSNYKYDKCQNEFKFLKSQARALALASPNVSLLWTDRTKHQFLNA